MDSPITLLKNGLYVEEFNMKMIVEEGMHDAEGILHFLSRILRPPTW